MASVNKVILVGNLGADPEVRKFDNGGMIATISIATSDKWTDKQTGEAKEHTEWHRIIFNDRLAEIVSQYLRKGASVYVEGSLRTRKWTDNNGIDRYSTEVRANSMQMLGSRSDNGTYNNNYNNANKQPNKPDPAYNQQNTNNQASYHTMFGSPLADQQVANTPSKTGNLQNLSDIAGKQDYDDDMPF